MTSIGGRPILRAARAVATVRRTGGFSTAPAAARPRLACELPLPAPNLAASDIPASRTSYGQWTASSSTASKVQRIAMLQQHFNCARDRPMASEAVAIDRHRTSAMVAPVMSAAEMAWHIARPPHKDGSTIRRQSRLAAGGQAQRTSEVQQFYDASQRRPDVATAATDDGLLHREATFGLYGSSSSIEPLGSRAAAPRDAEPRIDAEKVAGWAVSTVGSQPTFSAGRWLHESRKTSERAARLEAIRQFYQRTGRTEWH